MFSVHDGSFCCMRNNKSVQRTECNDFLRVFLGVAAHCSFPFTFGVWVSFAFVLRHLVITEGYVLFPWHTSGS